MVVKPANFIRLPYMPSLSGNSNPKHALLATSSDLLQQASAIVYFYSPVFYFLVSSKCCV